MNGLLYGGVINVGIGIYMLMTYYSQTGKYLLTSNEAKKMIDSGEIDHIIDVRTNMEWNIGHHPKAIHIPRHKLSKKKLNEEKINKNDVILVYCNTGQRARLATEQLVKIGYEAYYITNDYKSLL